MDNSLKSASSYTLAPLHSYWGPVKYQKEFSTLADLCLTTVLGYWCTYFSFEFIALCAIWILQSYVDIVYF